MRNQVQFSDIYKSFDSSMRALYDLHTSVEVSLGSSEWKAIGEYFHEAFSLFDNYNPAEIQTILERLIKIDIEDETLDYRKVWEAVNVDKDDIVRLENEREVFLKEIQDGLNGYAEKYPEKVNNFFRAYLKSQREEPLKSEVSRHGLLLSAVSQFEFLVLHLLRSYFIVYEHDNQLDEIYVVEKLDDEISQRIGIKKKLRYYSTSEKLDYLLDKFPVNNGFSRDNLKEILARRNVFTHRAGRVDDDYAKYNKNTQPGDRLRINQNYLNYALEYLYLWGIVVCVKVWDKLGATDDKAVSRGISATTMQLIRDGRYGFCAKLCEGIYNNLQFKSHVNKDIFLINYAISLDKLGDKKGMTKILSKIRQFPRQSEPHTKKLSSHDPILSSVLMAVNALEGNNQRAMEFFEYAAGTGEVTFLDLDYWVIFDYLRNEPRFSELRAKLESKVKIV